MDERFLEYAPERDIYRLLQVDPRADTATITAACRRLALYYHPDYNRSPRATEEMQVVNAVRRLMTDPVARARYDMARRRWLAEQAVERWPTAGVAGPAASRSAAAVPPIAEPIAARRPRARQRLAAATARRLESAWRVPLRRLVATPRPRRRGRDRPARSVELPLATIPLARDSVRILLLPALLLGGAGLAVLAAVGVVGLAGGGQPIVALVAAVALAVEAAILTIAGLLLAAAVLTLRIEVAPGTVRLRWLGGRRAYRLAAGPVLRIGPDARGRLPLEPRLRLFGLALGPGRLHGAEPTTVVSLGPGRAALVLPVDGGHLALVARDEAALLSALAAAATLRAERAPAYEEPPPLLSGIERERREAALAGAAARRGTGDRPPASVAAPPSDLTGRRGRRLRVGLVSVTAGLLLAAAVGWSLRPAGDGAQAVLRSTASPAPTAAPAPSASAQPSVGGSPSASPIPLADATPSRLPAPSPPPTPSRPPASPSAGPPTTLVDETFDLETMGRFDGAGWEVDGDPAAFTVAARPTSVQRSAQLLTPASGVPFRACRDLRPISADALEVEAVFLIEPLAATTVIALLGDDEPRAAVGLGETGALLVRDGDSELDADAELDPDAWYAVTLTVDLDAGTYGWRLAEAAEGAAPVDSGAGLALGAGDGLDAVCFGSPAVAGGALYLDVVRAVVR